MNYIVCLLKLDEFVIIYVVTGCLMLEISGAGSSSEVDCTGTARELDIPLLYITI